jgi:competence protein ComEA
LVFLGSWRIGELGGDVPDIANRYRIALAAGAVLVAVVAGMWWGTRAPEPVPVVVEADEADPTRKATITVHVSGAVASPGLVQLVPGARVADAVAAAGGALPAADLGRVNLAADIGDGEQIEIPAHGAEIAGSDAGGASSTGVDLNRASAEELQQLPGVGPVLAGRIVDHRDEYGAFESLEDLLDVAGIGEAKLDQLRSAVSRP